MLNQTVIYKTRNQIKVKVDVLKFFQQDVASRLEPGIKDCIIVECGYNVPYSTFCKFRPFWVLKPSVSKRDTCM